MESTRKKRDSATDADGYQQHEQQPQSNRRSLPVVPTNTERKQQQQPPRMSLPVAAAAGAATAIRDTTVTSTRANPQSETGPRTRREIRKLSEASTTVDMRSVIDEEKLSSLGWSDRLRMAKSYKEEGNFKYRNHVYNTAIGKYRLALIYLDADTSTPHPLKVSGSEPPTDSQLEELKQLKVDCLNNVAACMLQKDKPDFEQIVQYCRQASAIAPSNVKALYRMGVALFHSNKPDEALGTFERVASLPEGSRGLLESNIQRYMDMCRAVIQRNNANPDDQARAPDSMRLMRE